MASAMPDRPILFSAPMVRALLAGTKTQTRRIAKVRKGLKLENLIEHGERREGSIIHATRDMLAPPRFAIGDRLWVKETWRTHRSWDDHKPSDVIPCSRLWYEADGRDNCDQHGKARVSIHMPRWASRLTLTVTDVRVERLQDISEADAIAEGCSPLSHPMGRTDLLWHEIGPEQWQAPTRWYRNLWDSINGPGAWDANPWVVAVSFDVREGNIDA